jgi:GrpB-like predicted nucleotidyltransferase (UPF0157 family)
MVDIQHIGSTSIPGLAAKPVIDIAIGVQELQHIQSCIPILGSAGLPDRRFLWRVSPEGQRYHLHLASILSPLWINPIAFRDYLRQHPLAAREYGQLKGTLAAKCGFDIGAYIDGKARFVEQILALASAEAAPSGTAVRFSQ